MVPVEEPSTSMSQQQTLVGSMDCRVTGLKKKKGKNMSTRPTSWVEKMQNQAKKKNAKKSKAVQTKVNKRACETGPTTRPDDNIQYFIHQGVEVPSTNVLRMNHDAPTEEFATCGSSTSYTQLLLGPWGNNFLLSGTIHSENTSYNQGPWGNNFLSSDTIHSENTSYNQGASNRDPQDHGSHLAPGNFFGRM